MHFKEGAILKFTHVRNAFFEGAIILILALWLLISVVCCSTPSWLLISVAAALYFLLKSLLKCKFRITVNWLQSNYVCEQRHIFRIIATPREILCFPR